MKINKFKFYKRKKIPIKFNLKNKLNYEVYGFIKKIRKRKEELIIQSGNTSILIYFSEIDESTIFPVDFEPIKFYNRIRLSEEQRQMIFQRDNFQCRYKLDGCLVGENLQIDHIIPVSKGGTNNDDNLVTACSNCNLKKGGKIIYPQ